MQPPRGRNNAPNRARADDSPLAWSGGVARGWHGIPRTCAGTRLGVPTGGGHKAGLITVLLIRAARPPPQERGPAPRAPCSRRPAPSRGAAGFPQAPEQPQTCGMWGAGGRHPGRGLSGRGLFRQPPPRPWPGFTSGSETSVARGLALKEMKISFLVVALAGHRRAERGDGEVAASIERGQGWGQGLGQLERVSGSPGAVLSPGDGAGEFGAPLVPPEVKPGGKEQSSGVGDARGTLGVVYGLLRPFFGGIVPKPTSPGGEGPRSSQPRLTHGRFLPIYSCVTVTRQLTRLFSASCSPC